MSYELPPIDPLLPAPDDLTSENEPRLETLFDLLIDV